MKTLRAYSGKQSVKDKYLARHHQHIELDTLIRGSGYMERTNAHWKGCNITCLLNSPKVKPEQVTTSHTAFETQAIHFPQWLGYLLDRIHERCSSMEFSQKFTADLLRAVPLGFSDWRTIQCKFLLYILQDVRHHNPAAVDPVIELFNRELVGGVPTQKEYRAAAAAAAADAADAAADAADAAADAADAADAAYAAADAADAADAAYAAADAAIDRYAIYLVKLFQDLKGE